MLLLDILGCLRCIYFDWSCFVESVYCDWFWFELVLGLD